MSLPATIPGPTGSIFGPRRDSTTPSTSHLSTTTLTKTVRHNAHSYSDWLAFLSPLIGTAGEAFHNVITMSSQASTPAHPRSPLLRWSPFPSVSRVGRSVAQHRLQTNITRNCGRSGDSEHERKHANAPPGLGAQCCQPKPQRE
jgi:hypothetical protein